MISYIKKLAYISGLTIDMKPDGIVLRSRSKVKRIILCCLSPLFLIAGFFIKTYAILRILYLERKAGVMGHIRAFFFPFIHAYFTTAQYRDLTKD